MNDPDVNKLPEPPAALAPAPGSAYRPKDQQWMQEMCELVKNKIPASHCFVIFAFPVSTTDRCYYASNAGRNDAIAALKEWIAYQESVNNWMKHENDDKPPPQPPWPK